MAKKVAAKKVTKKHVKKNVGHGQAILNYTTKSFKSSTCINIFIW